MRNKIGDIHTHRSKLLSKFINDQGLLYFRRRGTNTTQCFSLKELDYMRVNHSQLDFINDFVPNEQDNNSILIKMIFKLK